MTKPVPYPADTKAKGWRFELDHERIDQSDTWALATPALRPWLLMTWLVSWKQIPCGSLPADDELIAARLGMDIDQFTGAKKVLMRGWWQADDGRLYHDTVVEMVQAMLTSKNKERDRKAAYRDRKATERGDLSRGTNTGHPGEVQVPATGCDDTRTRTRTGTYIPEPGFSARANADGDFLGEPAARAPEQPADPGVAPSARPAAVPAAGRPAPGAVTFSMKRAGMADTNPSHPKLMALIASGATVDEFVEAARKAVAGGKGFGYALAIVEGQRKDAAALAGQLHTGPLPAKPGGVGGETFRQRDTRVAAERMAQFAPGVALSQPVPVEHPRSILSVEVPDVLALPRH